MALSIHISDSMCRESPAGAAEWTSNDHQLWLSTTSLSILRTWMFLARNSWQGDPGGRLPLVNDNRLDADERLSATKWSLRK